MKGSSEGSVNPDRRILRTLEQYFEFEIDANHPLLDQVETRHLSGGEWLMQQGDPGNSLYFLVRGRLQAWARDASGNARGHFLNEIVPGDSVGELSLLTGAPRTVGIQAVRDSLLIRIGREDFEKLSHEHPALALRLATNVASLLQSSSAQAKPSTRDLSTISLLLLDKTARTGQFCRDLIAEIEKAGKTLCLTAGELGRHGAPVDSISDDDPIPHSLSHWVHDREDEHRFVIYRCRSENQSWSEFAIRQSDMVLFIGDSTMNPLSREWESRLEAATGSAVARRMLILLQPPPGSPIRNTKDWLAHRKADFHVHVREGVPDDTARVARIVSGKALGLVLAGGAARGFAHLGVYRAMREAGLPVDWVGGTSLGAIMAAALASPWSLDEAVDISRECFVKGKPFSDFTLPVISMISGGRMDRLLKKYLDFQIEDLPTPFYCISCHLDSGDMVLHESGYLPDAIRASAAIPGIIPPAIVDNRLAVDGAVINNLPVDVMQRKPVGTIVAVELSSDKQYEVKYDSMPSAWAVLRGRYLPFARRYRVPSLSTIMLKATELGTLERVRELGKQADLLLNPPVRQFGMTEVKSFDRIVQVGYEHARTEIANWLAQPENL